MGCDVIAVRAFRVETVSLCVRVLLHQTVSGLEIVIREANDAAERRTCHGAVFQHFAAHLMEVSCRLRELTNDLFNGTCGVLHVLEILICKRLRVDVYAVSAFHVLGQLRQVVCICRVLWSRRHGRVCGKAACAASTSHDNTCLFFRQSRHLL